MLDDSEISRHVLAGVLESRGVKVLNAKDAEKIIAYCGHPLANMGISIPEVEPYRRIEQGLEKWQSSGKRKMPKLK